MVGGKETRLAPLKLDTPKSLITIHGSPFLSLLVSWLLRYLPTATVVCGPVAADYKRVFAGNSRVKVSAQKQRGNGADLLSSISEMHSDLLLVCNGDTVVDVSLPGLFAFHSGHNKVASIVISRRTDIPNAGALSVDSDGLIVASTEARVPSYALRTPSWVGGSTGMFLCEYSFLSTLRPDEFPSIEMDVLPKLIQNNQLYAYDNDQNLVLDYGTPDRLRRLREIEDVVQLVLSR